MHLATIRVLLCLCLLSIASSAHACGKDANCDLGDGRHYRIVMPEGYDGASKIGAIIWSHGYRGNAAGMMKNKSMVRLASELGVALVSTKSFGRDWRIPGSPADPSNKGVEEFVYFERLAVALETKHNIDLQRTLSSGFSAGGMMVWNLICHRSDLFAAYAPVSGTFWEPEPATCDSPVTNVVHIHGDNDPVVPLMGRPIATTHQGQVPDVLDMYAKYGGFEKSRQFNAGQLTCESSKNAKGNMLDFCLFKGGHSFSTDYIRQAWKMLDKAGAFSS